MRGAGENGAAGALRIEGHYGAASREHEKREFFAEELPCGICSSGECSIFSIAGDCRASLGWTDGGVRPSLILRDGGCCRYASLDGGGQSSPQPSFQRPVIQQQ